MTRTERSCRCRNDHAGVCRQLMRRGQDLAALRHSAHYDAGSNGVRRASGADGTVTRGEIMDHGCEALAILAKQSVWRLRLLPSASATTDQNAQLPCT